MEIEAGALYVVGTPIGNLSDLSPRAVEVLSKVDFVAAEDTRVSGKLLSLFDIKKPLVSYYEHNKYERAQVILERLLSGESCAVVTDAGMPCISDPGEVLVQVCAEHGVSTVVIPGPSAVIAALCISGLSTSRFAFEGFLTTNRSGRMEHLHQVKDDTHTLVFYEAPHKLLTTLKDMSEVFGPERKISLVRELTKLHEQVVRTTLGKAVERYSSQSPRGEFVLVVEGAAPGGETRYTLEDAVARARELMEQGQSASYAAKTAAKETGLKKGAIYDALNA